MVQYNPKTWFNLIFTPAGKSSDVSSLRCWAWACGRLGVLREMEVLEAPIKLSNVVHSLLGFILSLFLVFRTNVRPLVGRPAMGRLGERVPNARHPRP